MAKSRTKSASSNSNVRSKPEKSGSPIKKILGGVFYTLFLGSALVIGTGAGWLSRSNTMKQAIPALLLKSPEEVFQKDYVTLLLLGCDEDLSVGGREVKRNKARTDMMMVARLDFKKNTITGLSIPRDTRVKMPGEPNHKINAIHALAKSGDEEDATRRAVESILPDVKIDEVLTIDYDAFVNMVDMLDGVEVNIDKAMKYTDVAGGLFIDLKPGRQVLDGYDAMCFVRFRKDAGSDLKRQERQKQLLVAIKDRVLLNWTKLPQIMDLGAQTVDMDGAKIAALAKFSRGVAKENIQLGQLPTKPGRGSFLEVDKSKLNKVLAKYDVRNRISKSSLAGEPSPGLQNNPLRGNDLESN